MVQGLEFVLVVSGLFVDGFHEISIENNLINTWKIPYENTHISRYIKKYGYRNLLLECDVTLMNFFKLDIE
jgi:hypothetical protein